MSGTEDAKAASNFAASEVQHMSGTRTPMRVATANEPVSPPRRVRAPKSFPGVSFAIPVVVLGRFAGLALLCGAAGCSSLLNAGSSEIAGIGGAAVAGAVTTDAALATGIGLGAQALGRTALQYSQRRVRRAAQDRIAEAAGDLEPGAVASWETDHAVPLENDEQGRVTVSRVISSSGLHCKEIVFSVDSVVDGSPRSGFYVASICRDGSRWKWASAEPAAERWGSLH